jgi:hypothetical protein
MKLPTILPHAALALLTLLPALGQSPSKPVPGKPEPVPPFLRGRPPAPEPTNPPARPFHDSQMRAVASISFNPHPYSTFSGALFYFSVTPNVTANQCAAQAIARAPHTVSTTQVAGVPFSHGYDEHGGICTESRDEIYTTPHNNACYRFDAVINNFCGGDVSGVQDITERELNDVRRRMQSILETVRFDN